MYWAIAQMRGDLDLLGRVVACVALEGDRSPEWWAQQHMWQVVARTDWAQAWEYALAAGTSAPGREPAVITDQMILSAVQEARS